MFTHQGLAEFDLEPVRIDLPSMQTTDHRFCITIAEGNQLDVGYILADGPELVMIERIGVRTNLCDSCQLDLRRGWNGTPVIEHQRTKWPVVMTPHVDYRTAEEKARDSAQWWVGTYMARCGNCGAPDQFVGEPCYYCRVRLEMPRP